MAGVALGTNVVTVLPPATPARPRISLLSQGNVVGDGQPTIVDSEGLLDSEQVDPWSFGAGTEWLDPIVAFESDRLWQGWPQSGDGDTLADKSHDITGNHDRTITRGTADLQPAQMPTMAVLFAKVGELTTHTLEQGPEGSVQLQAERAFDAMLPRLVEYELWAAVNAQSMAYDGQFRLQGQGVTVHVPVTTAPGFLRALSILESTVAQGGFLDQWGGAFYHCTRGLASLMLSSSHGLYPDPTGRTIITGASGARVIPESGATGVWPSQSGELVTTPTSTTAGDDLATGWLIASAPVRVRLGRRFYVEQHDLRASGGLTNDRVVLVEQPFILESSLEVVAVPVDYTKEF